MGTLTANCPRLDTHCPHKLATSCRLTSTPSCCACADTRPHSSTYSVYIDGVGFVQRGTRWQSYCWFCKEFWNNRIAASEPPLEPSQTQIPLVPDQALFLEQWWEFHRGYRVVKTGDGEEDQGQEQEQETRIAVCGERFAEVSPGLLPRTLDQVRAGVPNNALRAENRTRRALLDSEIDAQRGMQQPVASLDDALDSLLQEADEEEEEGEQEEQLVRDLEQEQQQPLIAELAASEQSSEAIRARARERLARVFGTREDVLRDDYESPLSQMYNRAWDRYRQAEQQRAQGEEEEGPVNPHGVAEPRPTATLEDQLVESVMRESRAAAAATTATLQSVGTNTGIDTISTGTGTQGDSNPVLREEAAAQILRHLGDRHESAQQLLRQLDQRHPVVAHFRRNEQGTMTIQPPWDDPAFQQSASASAATPEPSSSSSPPSRRSPTSPSNSPRTSRLRLSTHTAPTTADPGSTASIAATIRTRAPTTSSLPALTSTADLQASLLQITQEVSRLRQATAAASLFTAQHGSGGPQHHVTETLDSQPDRPAPLPDSAMLKNLACQVCYAQLADVAVLPCGHMVMCQWCADVVVPVKHGHFPARPSKCPMCRKGVKQRYKIHVG